MKILVTYWTQTGNTQKVAEAIFDALTGEKTMAPIRDVTSTDGFDLIFIGFPIIQFGVPRAAATFIRDYARGRPVAVFVTHAIISDSADLIQRTMLEKELEKCRAVCTDSTLKGLFHCQGELSEKMAKDLMETNIPMLSGFAQMRSLTIGHPDLAELAMAASFARKMCLTL